MLFVVNQSTKQEGQALVEFALVLGIFLFLFLVMIEAFGLYRQRYGLDQVAREGARLAAEYGGNAPEVERYILQQLDNLLLDTADVTITVTAHEFTGREILPISPTRSTCAYGEFVAVTVSAPWRVSIPGGGLFVQMITSDGLHRAEHLDKCWRSGGAW
jgi:Flp pilus assembly protein TadG